ncbi:uncharacterized protein LOC114353251 isoform X2 [Ostrinia furnacalis]|uniref:uncharacterized protein LOC114353251 isoform X2 n=1 Tax=Ostrinia furnacalis TaxID=93504 RepID=UPI00104025D5|nr:uncharacterized protein LOC114353251 isoform X2 [Ostrinia furnacalis]
MAKDSGKLKVLFALQDECKNNLVKAETNFKKSPRDRLKRPYLEARLESLESLYYSFKEGHKAIVSETLTDRNHPYFIEDKYENFEELYIQYKALLRENLQSLLTSTQTTTTTPVVTQNLGQCDLKLPRITLPTFSGKYEEWQTFFDMFSSLIHQNKHITAVEKLHYLKSNLSGEAQNLLSNFSTTDANYEEAWKQLMRRYNNKRYISNAVLRNLFSVKKLNNESANLIKQLLDTTSTCLKSLDNIGVSTSEWDAIIVFLVVSKLDTESIKQWEQHMNSVNSDELPTWEQLREYLESRFRSLEMIDTNVTRTIPARTTPAAKPKAFHASIENKCKMCQENHFLNQCKEYGLLTPNKRQDFVQSNKLCFNCLSPTHSVAKCRLPTSCKRCGRRHHTTLHYERENRDSNQQTTAANERDGATVTSRDYQCERTSTSSGGTHITTAFSRGKLQPTCVLLATARVKLHNSAHHRGQILITYHWLTPPMQRQGR